MKILPPPSLYGTSGKRKVAISRHANSASRKRDNDDDFTLKKDNDGLQAWEEVNTSQHGDDYFVNQATPQHFYDSEPKTLSPQGKRFIIPKEDKSFEVELPPNNASPEVNNLTVEQINRTLEDSQQSQEVILNLVQKKQKVSKYMVQNQNDDQNAQINKLKNQHKQRKEQLIAKIVKQ